jgi:hypothetical protein
MPSTTSQLSRIEALASCFDNADTHDMAAAAANIANNCPAFWHRAAGGNAAVTGFIFFLNRTQDVVRAWELYEHEFQRPSKMRDEAMLDHLLPLNAGAVHSLAAAYVALGSFRASRDLIARTDKAEGAALDALRALRRTQPAPLIDAIGGLDYSRIDAAARAINREAPSAPVVAGAVNLAEVA